MQPERADRAAQRGRTPTDQGAGPGRRGADPPQKGTDHTGEPPVSLPRGSCPHGGGLVLTTAVCRTCERSMVVDAVMAVAAGATHAVVAEVVAEVTEGPAALRSIRQALTGGPGALLVGAPPAVGRLVVALRERGVDLPEP